MGSIRNLTYRHAARDQAVLRGLDLEIAAGERILLTGSSGAGKSTLLAALAGILGDEEGEYSGEICVPGPVGMVLQDPDSQVIAARIGDDAAFGCENLGVPRAEIWPRVRQSLDLVGLDLPLDHPTELLSGGQKQRLALAGVIAMGARLILLDEPTANLDPEGRTEVVAAVDRVLSETGASLVVVEHDHELWSEIIDRNLALVDGHLVPVERRQARPGLPAARSPRAGSLIVAEELLTRWGPARSFEIPAAASTVITGPNGAGKSTLALTLGGLLAPQRGELRLAPELRQGLSGPPHRWRSADLARRIGTVFQNPEHQFLTRSVRAELEIGNPAAERIRELLDRLRLSHLSGVNPFTLSGGEKRRLSVATALAAAPPLIILDEPTFGQDPGTFRELVHLLRELADSGTTVISVTHDPDFIAALGDHRLEILP